LSACELSNSHTSGHVTCNDYDVFTHESESVRGLQCQVSYETEGLFTPTGSHEHCKSGRANIS